jgi:CheY-like chemotaxis protein
MLSATEKESNESEQIMIKLKLFAFGKSSNALPALSPRAAEAVAPLKEETPTNPNGKRVLIVDDDPLFLKATSKKLLTAGFQVRTAKESAEAIAALGEHPADVVLLDINFPPDICNGGMGSWDGFQILSWLRGLPVAKGVRFIMVSSSDSASDRQRAQQLGAVAYYRKPLDHNRLFTEVNAAT